MRDLRIHNVSNWARIKGQNQRGRGEEHRARSVQPFAANCRQGVQRFRGQIRGRHHQVAYCHNGTIWDLWNDGHVQCENCSSYRFVSFNSKKGERNIYIWIFLEEILDCAICETTVTALDKLLNNPKIDHAMEHVLKKACLALSTKHQEKVFFCYFHCRDFYFIIILLV